MASRWPCRVASFLAVTALFHLALPSPSASAGGRCKHVDARPGAASYAALGRATMCLVNQARRRRGLPSLRADRRLARAAMRHATDMVRRSYFTHSSLSGTRFTVRIAKAGYLRGAARWSVGENLAWGGGRRSTPRRIFQSWMDSPSHRANILKRRFRDIGVGVVAGVPVRQRYSAGATYVHEFGARG